MAQSALRPGELPRLVLIDPSPYLGLQWQSMGRGPKYDCWGLVCLVLDREFNIGLPSFSYGNDTAAAIELGIHLFERITSPQPGDLVLYTDPLHIGILTCPDRMLHITHGKDACVERIGAFRVRRIAGYYRVRDTRAKRVRLSRPMSSVERYRPRSGS